MYMVTLNDPVFVLDTKTGCVYKTQCLTGIFHYGTRCGVLDFFAARLFDETGRIIELKEPAELELTQDDKRVRMIQHTGERYPFLSSVEETGSSRS